MSKRSTARRAMTSTDLIFLDLNNQKRVDLLYLLLVHSNRFSSLPELYEIFGKEALIKFLDIFEGQRLTVPSAKDLKKAVREVNIYSRLIDKPKGTRAKVMRELASDYTMTVKDVAGVFAQMRELMQSYKIKKILDPASE